MSTSTSTSTLLSDPSTGATARASSILNRNATLYGPMNVLDYSSSSKNHCWNSSGRRPQSSPLKQQNNNNDKKEFIIIHLGQPAASLDCIKIQFQGGFVGTPCDIYIGRRRRRKTKTQTKNSSSGSSGQQNNTANTLVEQNDNDNENDNDNDNDNDNNNCIIYDKQEEDWEWDDCNDLQTCSFTTTTPTAPTTTNIIDSIRLEFQDSTDFYGRVTIYRIEVWGEAKLLDDNDDDKDE